jgi:hypothetical protein
MDTRTLASTWLTLLILTGCTVGQDSSGTLSAAATPTQAATDTGAERVARTKPKVIDLPWGDGQRKTAFYTYRFNYTPVLPDKRPDDTVTSLQITPDGQVTITYAGAYKEPVRGELTADERTTFTQISENLSFEYKTCPRLPVDPQPTYTWQDQGTNHEFRPTCPANPTGLTAVLTPQVATSLGEFVQGLAKRLIDQTI